MLSRLTRVQQLRQLMEQNSLPFAARFTLTHLKPPLKFAASMMHPLLLQWFDLRKFMLSQLLSKNDAPFVFANSHDEKHQVAWCLMGGCIGPVKWTSNVACIVIQPQCKECDSRSLFCPCAAEIHTRINIPPISRVQAAQGNPVSAPVPLPLRGLLSKGCQPPKSPGAIKPPAPHHF